MVVDARHIRARKALIFDAEESQLPMAVQRAKYFCHPSRRKIKLVPDQNTEKRGFSEPWDVQSKDDCWFYHCIDLPGETIAGMWDMRGRSKEYFGHVDLTGKSVLDIGTASGFLSFEAEKMGASQVVGFEAWNGRIREMVPTRQYRENKERYFRELDASMVQMKRGYWYAHSRLQSKARAYYGDIYDIGEDVGNFDVAIIGQILVQLKNPLSCIEQVATRIRPGGTLIITEGMSASPDPVAQFIWTPDGKASTYSWWFMSEEFFTQFLRVLDFEKIGRSTAKYGLVLPGQEPVDYELPTLVFRKMIV